MWSLAQREGQTEGLNHPPKALGMFFPVTAVPARSAGAILLVALRAPCVTDNPLHLFTLSSRDTTLGLELCPVLA